MAKAANKLRSWRITLIRDHGGVRIGTVEAATAEEAIGRDPRIWHHRPGAATPPGRAADRAGMTAGG